MIILLLTFLNSVSQLQQNFCCNWLTHRAFSTERPSHPTLFWTKSHPAKLITETSTMHLFVSFWNVETSQWKWGKGTMMTLKTSCTLSNMKTNFEHLLKVGTFRFKVNDHYPSTKTRTNCRKKNKWKLWRLTSYLWRLLQLWKVTGSYAVENRSVL